MRISPLPSGGLDSRPLIVHGLFLSREALEVTLDDLESAYLEASGGDARDALRRALADAMEEIATVNSRVSRGYVRASRPADLARKLGSERRASAAAERSSAAASRA